MKNKENVKIGSKISSLNPYMHENGIISRREIGKIWHPQWFQASNTDDKGFSYLKIDYPMVSSENRTFC